MWAGPFQASSGQSCPGGELSDPQAQGVMSELAPVSGAGWCHWRPGSTESPPPPPPPPPPAPAAEWSDHSVRQPKSSLRRLSCPVRQSSRHSCPVRLSGCPVRLCGRHSCPITGRHCCPTETDSGTQPSRSGSPPRPAKSRWSAPLFSPTKLSSQAKSSGLFKPSGQVDL